jgi:hypothetical protein
MKLVDEVKQFFWLRRIALAAERQADSFDKIVRILEADHTHPKPPRKHVELGLMDQDEINKQFLKRLEAERDGIELED